MATLFDDHCTRAEHKVDVHRVVMLRLQGEIDTFITDLIPLAKPHYVDPDIAARRIAALGFELAAAAFRELLPTTKKARSGDVGEILGTEYVDAHTEFTVAIRRLRWKDGRESALRGDDFVGVEVGGGESRFLKGEAKCHKALSNNTLDEAIAALQANDWRPTPHSLLLIATHLREAGDHDLAERHELAALAGLKVDAVSHLLFLCTESDWEDSLRSRIAAAVGPIPQTIVCVVADDHPGLVAAVYEALNG